MHLLDIIILNKLEQFIVPPNASLTVNAIMFNETKQNNNKQNDDIFLV